MIELMERDWQMQKGCARGLLLLLFVYSILNICASFAAAAAAAREARVSDSWSSAVLASSAQVVATARLAPRSDYLVLHYTHSIKVLGKNVPTPVVVGSLNSKLEGYLSSQTRRSGDTSSKPARTRNREIQKARARANLTGLRSQLEGAS